MKILTLSNCRLDPILGSGKTRLRWTEGLRRRGHEVHVLAPFDLLGSFYRPPGRRFRLAVAARFISQACDYDMIECFGSEFGWFTSVWHGRKDRPLFVAHTDGCELLASKRMAEVQQPSAEQPLRANWIGSLHQRLDSAAFQCVDGFVTGCQADLDYIRQCSFYPDEMARSIELGLDELYLGRPFQEKKDHRVIYVGTWSERKAPQRIVRVMSAVLRSDPSVFFDIYGAWSERDCILAAFEPAIRGRVRVHSKVSLEQLVNGMDRAKVFFFPSHYEGFGLALAEAMACSSAAVTTPTGFGANLTHGENALVFAFNDEDGMVQGILELLHNKKSREDIARKGWSRVQSLQWEAQIDRLDVTYREWQGLWDRKRACFVDRDRVQPA